MQRICWFFSYNGIFKFICRLRISDFWIHSICQCDRKKLKLFVLDGIQLTYLVILTDLDPFSGNPTKWSSTLKQSVGKSRRIV